MTEQQKVSRLQQIRNFIDKQEKGRKEYEELPLAGNAIRVAMDKKLTERLAEWNNSIKIINAPIQAATLYGYATELIDIIEATDIMVKRVGLVYTRAGDKGKEPEVAAVRGWSNLYGIFHSMALRRRFDHGTDDPVTKQATEKQNIHAIKLREFQIALENVFFKKANTLIGWSFEDLDIRPGVVTVVQTMPTKDYMPTTMQHPKGFANGPSQDWGNPQYTTDGQQ